MLFDKVQLLSNAYLISCFEALPFVTEVTREGPLVTVAKPDVDLQSCQSGAGHVTERTLHLIHWKSKKRTHRILSMQNENMIHDTTITN